jgi:hypothetical protein
MGSAPQLEKYQFRPGHAGGPGRPIGSRAKLQELAVKLLHKDFVEHGEEVIKRVREKKPEVYLASVVSLLPKQAQKLESPFIDLSDDELEQLEELLAAMRAKTVQALDGTATQRSNGHRSQRKSNATSSGDGGARAVERFARQRDYASGDEAPAAQESATTIDGEADQSADQSAVDERQERGEGSS